MTMVTNIGLKSSSFIGKLHAEKEQWGDGPGSFIA